MTAFTDWCASIGLDWNPPSPKKPHQTGILRWSGSLGPIKVAVLIPDMADRNGGMICYAKSQIKEHALMHMLDLARKARQKKSDDFWDEMENESILETEKSTKIQFSTFYRQSKLDQRPVRRFLELVYGTPGP